MTGLAPETGALLMPTGQRWRLGATFRAPVSGGVLGSGRSAGGLVLPTNIEQPWETEVGVAYQLGPRPLNPSWINPHEQESRVRNYIADERARRERRNEEIVIAAAPEQRGFQPFDGPVQQRVVGVPGRVQPPPLLGGERAEHQQGGRGHWVLPSRPPSTGLPYR